MNLLLTSFLAGILTVLAPCVLTLLPVILGGSLGENNRWRPLVIALSLGASVLIFTLLLKATSTFIGLPETVLRWISGGLVALFGITMLFPDAWNKIAFRLGLYKSEALIEKSNETRGNTGAILLGASLGPVFSTCSPTFTLIVATVLPQDFGTALINLIAYTLGLMLLLLLIGYGGQRIARFFRPAANPYGWFKRTLGVLLMLTGLAILTGYDKKIESYILDQGYLGPINIEENLLKKVENMR